MIYIPGTRNKTDSPKNISFFGYDSKIITKTILLVVIFFNFFHILNKRRKLRYMVSNDVNIYLMMIMMRNRRVS